MNSKKHQSSFRLHNSLVNLTVYIIAIETLGAGAGPALFMFGDSLSDTGNEIIANPNASVCKAIAQPPYGMTFFHHPAGRVSDGRLIIDFLATQLGLPLLNPYLGKKDFAQGVNFAVAGATAISLKEYDLESVAYEDRPHFETELEWFIEFQKSSLGNGLSPAFFGHDALYVVEIGGNDYGKMWDNGWSTDKIESRVDHIVGNIRNHILRLLAAGARRFMIMNLPVQGCSPWSMVRALPHEEKDERLGCVVRMKRIGEKHNLKLRAMVAELQAEFEGDAWPVYADFHSIMDKILENPLDYGIVNRREACCGIFTQSINVDCGETKLINNAEVKGTACLNPSSYMFWNDNHFTEHFYKIIANSFFDLLQAPQDLRFRA